MLASYERGLRDTPRTGIVRDDGTPWQAADTPDQPPLLEDAMTTKPLPDIEYLRQCFLYDKETGILRWNERPVTHFKSVADFNTWNHTRAGQKAGSYNKAGRLTVGMTINGESKNFLGYRLIWKMETGEEPQAIDHINRNCSDDRFVNLRAATFMDNLANARGVGTRGLPKGVSIFRKTQYRAQIVRNYINYHLGYYATPEEAAEAYRQGALRLHGEFACFATIHDNKDDTTS